MLKLNENYIISCNDKDIGKLTIYSIYTKKNNVKRRYHHISKSYMVSKYIK